MGETGATDQLIVKFRQLANIADQRHAIHTILGDDALEAEQVFPDCEEIELATLLSLRLRSGTNLNDAVRKLAAAKDVEYTHTPSERHPL